ncbi:MAG: DUF721 domain-containing protein [Chthonomonas sp.]|nr:DUF721 domain-containing protein [Chthonomonas sp.]
MRRLSDLLALSVDRPEVLRASRAQPIVRRWKEFAGPVLGERCVPDRYDHGTLWIAAKGNAWEQELRFQKDRILAMMNEAAGEELFTQMRIGTRPPRRDWEAAPDPLKD